MWRVRNNMKRWRLRWPWTWLFPLKVDQRYCRECGLPYHEGPLPKEVATYNKGSISAFVYPAGSYGCDRFEVRFGRWRAKAKLCSSGISSRRTILICCSQWPCRHEKRIARVHVPDVPVGRFAKVFDLVFGLSEDSPQRSSAAMTAAVDKRLG